MADLPATAFFALAPDWLCEVVSPGTKKLDRTRKLPLYAAAQVRHVWLLDPIDRLLEVFRNDGATLRPVGRFAEDTAVRAEPFDAVELDMERWLVARLEGPPGPPVPK
jgi:Uma2 family endonuclease